MYRNYCLTQPIERMFSMSEKQDSVQINSLKTALSLSLTFTTQMKNDSFDLTSNQLIVITAAGTICGTPITEFPDEKDIGDLIFSNAYERARSISNSGSADCLILKNATLVSAPGFKQLFKTLFVFPEDIIAITFGDASDNN